MDGPSEPGLFRTQTLPPSYSESSSSLDAPPSFTASLDLPQPIGAEDRFWLSKFGLVLSDTEPQTLSLSRSKERRITFSLGPIHEAALRNDYTLLPLLEEIGAYSHIDEKCSSQKTALHYACLNGCLEFARLLLSLGADLHLETLQRETPFSLACSSGNLELVQYLLSRGAQLNPAGSNHPLCAALAAKRAHIALYLLSIGSSVSGVSLNGDTPLHYALSNGLLDLANLLLDKSCPPHMPNNQCLRPIHIAAQKGYTHILSRLISAGAEVWDPARDHEAFTPLHFAAAEGRREVVKILLESKADVSAKSAGRYGYSHPKCEGKSWGSTPLHLAVEKGYLDIVWLLLQHGSLINERRWDMRTPLVIAAEKGHHAIARMLLEKKAKTELEALERRTALHFATLNGDVAMLELLTEFGADVNAKMWRSWTALHLAAQKGYSDCIAVLLGKGAKVNATGEDGETPLDVAEGEGMEEAAEALRRGKAKGGSRYKGIKLSVHYGWKSPEWSKYAHVKGKGRSRD